MIGTPVASDLAADLTSSPGIDLPNGLPAQAEQSVAAYGTAGHRSFSGGGIVEPGSTGRQLFDARPICNGRDLTRRPHNALHLVPWRPPTLSPGVLRPGHHQLDAVVYGVRDPGRFGTLGDVSTLCVQCGPLVGLLAAATTDHSVRRQGRQRAASRQPDRASARSSAGAQRSPSRDSGDG